MAEEAIERACSLIDTRVLQSVLFLLRQFCCWTLASEFCSTDKYVGRWGSLGHQYHGNMT